MSEQEQESQTTGISTNMSVEFTLHVLLDDGTTKDIKCVGQVESIEPEEGKE